MLLEFGSISCDKTLLTHILDSSFDCSNAVNVPKEASQASFKFHKAF